MKATLKLEAFGDNHRQGEKLWRSILNKAEDGFGDRFFGKAPSPYWVAEIVGLHPKFKFERKFLPFRKDYTHANSKGSRGVFVWYILESGKVYEVKEQVSWKNSDRYFCRVTEAGDIDRISKEEVEEWIKNTLE